MIRVEGATIRAGGNEILVDASLHLRPGDHAGLVGRNGSGKTTLLRGIVGEIPLDTGQIVRRRTTRVGWLPQQAVSGSVDTVWNEASSAMVGLNALQAEVEAAQGAVSSAQGDLKSVERLDRATEAFRMAGGFARDERIGEVLHGLGFGPDDWHRTCDTFSGGWQMRIALARLLLSDPDVALLDEPTNHLDLEARTWLAGFLDQAPWAFLVVSHDRWLLERCVKRVVEVRHRRLQTYSGGYRSFLQQRALAGAQLQTAHTRQQKEIAKLERFVERFGAKATKAAQARSRQNRLDRMDRVEAPVAAQRGPRLRLPEPPGGSVEAVTLASATLGYGDGPAVLKDVDLTLMRGTRTVLLGENGCGKSTVLQAVAGRLPLQGGRRRLGDRVRIGVFSQDLAASLPVEPSGLEHLTQEVPTVPPEKIRAVLGGLGLPGDMALRPIGALSGGERARVALAALVVRPCNVLLLDEPTNHLDVEATEVLAEALCEWPGALLLVTHDRWLVERVGTHVARVHAGHLDVREGVRPEDFERRAAVAGAVDPEEGQAAEAHADRKKRNREMDRMRRRIVAIEDEVPAAEAEVARIDEALIAAATDHAKATALGIERDAAAAVVEGLYGEWEALEADLAEG